MWGPSRLARVKEVIFRVLSPGYRTSPLMWTRYERQVSVAQVARTPGAIEVLLQAVWRSCRGGFSGGLDGGFGTPPQR